MRLLIQNDDYGITPAVSAGIRRAIREGLIRNTGMFVNMPASYQAAQDIKDMSVCLGLDINYVCGKSITKPELIPNLVKKDGSFLTSQEIKKNNKLVSIGEFGIVSVFENDPYPLAEIYLETENQVKKFIELVGRPPEYIHMHSVVTPNALQAAIQVAEAYNIYHSSSLMRDYQAVPGTFDSGNLSSIESQLEYNVLENLLTRDLPSLKQDETYYFICHGGYVDSDLLQYSSLTLRRALDLATVLDSRLAEYINNEEIELITYRDLAN